MQLSAALKNRQSGPPLANLPVSLTARIDRYHESRKEIAFLKFSPSSPVFEFISGDLASGNYTLLCLPFSRLFLPSLPHLSRFLSCGATLLLSQHDGWNKDLSLSLVVLEINETDADRKLSRYVVFVAL